MARTAPGDLEVLAIVHEKHTLFPLKSLWLQDRGNRGLRAGAWGPRNPAYASYFGVTAATPFHPWDYADKNTGVHYADPVGLGRVLLAGVPW